MTSTGATDSQIPPPGGVLPQEIADDKSAHSWIHKIRDNPARIFVDNSARTLEGTPLEVSDTKTSERPTQLGKFCADLQKSEIGPPTDSKIGNIPTACFAVPFMRTSALSGSADDMIDGGAQNMKSKRVSESDDTQARKRSASLDSLLEPVRVVSGDAGGRSFRLSSSDSPLESARVVSGNAGVSSRRPPSPLPRLP